MKKAEQLRQIAESCAELAETAPNEPTKKRFQRMAEGWRSVAETQAWLDGDTADTCDKAA